MGMRYSILLLSVTLAACSHTSDRTSTQSSNVTVMPGTYAVAAKSSTPHTPLVSSECAKGFDSTISYLEYLMEQRQAQAQSAL